MKQDPDEKYHAARKDARARIEASKYVDGRGKDRVIQSRVRAVFNQRAKALIAEAKAIIKRREAEADAIK